MENEYQCCGCTACVNICPVKAMDMKRDSEGFLYPHIDTDKCIHCGKCEQVCMYKVSQEHTEYIKTYAAYIKDQDIRIQSTSGGIYYVLAEYILERGGVVISCAFDENYRNRHICFSEMKDLKKAMGTRYVQSDKGDVFKKGKDYLENGKYVLFSGTPCETEGFRRYLGKSYDNLLLQDIVCHSTPSPLVFEKYKEYLTQRKKAIREINFRDKKNGWDNSFVSIRFDDATEYISPKYQDSFMQLFIKNISVRPSCFNCKVRNIKRNSDFTLGDFWGINECIQKTDMHKNEIRDGISLIMVHTIKGEKILQEVSSKLQLYPTNIKDTIKYNPSAVSVRKNFKRDIFFRKLNENGFQSAAEAALKETIMERVILHILNSIQKKGMKKS